MATTSRKSTPRRLGRGLDSLISTPVQVDPPTAVEDPPATTEAVGTAIVMLPIEGITASPAQPRQHFDQQAIDGLAASIKSAGVMQPILVRPRGGGGHEIVSGERRWRAASTAGLETIPAIVRELDDRTAAEWSLIENLQREDLNPMERAEAFQRLVETFGLTHQQVAERVGLERSSVTNHLRLNELDVAMKEAVRSGVLSLGHAKVLLSVQDPGWRTALATRAVKDGWSVRMLERRARVMGGGTPTTPDPTRATHLVDLERRLGDHLGTRVRIRPGRKSGSGSLELAYYSLEEFDGLMRRLGFDADARTE